MRRHSEDDRCHVLSNGDYYLYGKRLFLKSLPERFRLDNSDFCTLPIWVQFPSLPIEFWHPMALSKIASCIGKPLWSDKMTKELKKGGFARVLIEIDTSTYPLEAVPVTTPNGSTFSQEVYYEIDPCFCTKCRSNNHYKEASPGIRKKNFSKRGKKAKSGGSKNNHVLPIVS